MIENILFMQTEDGFVTFEKSNKETIIYPLCMVPIEFQKEGKLLRAIIHNEEHIEFIGFVPEEENQSRRDLIHSRSERIRRRFRRHKL